MDTVTAAGSFLVATPLVGGPPFDRTVIAMLEHDSEGAIGLILNSPTELDAGLYVPEVASVLAEPPLVHFGGPVATDSAVVVGRTTAPSMTGSAIRSVRVVDPHDPPADLTDVRVYAGYAGWSPGQLERELEEGAWWVIPERPDGWSGERGTSYWTACVLDAPGRIPFHATYNDTPWLN